MASTINEIAIENFFNYSEICTYDFDKGLNLVLAQNGQGKTNFINLIKWVVTNRMTFTEPRPGDRVVESNSQIPNELIYVINNKAKIEAKINESIDSRIILKFTDSHNHNYCIEKSIITIKTDDDIYSKNWTFSIPPTKIWLQKGSDLTPITESEEKNKIIKKLMTPDVLPYTILVGEDLNTTINFADKQAVNQTIEHLTNISYFKDIVNSSDEVLKQLESKRKSFIKENSKDREKSERFANDINIVENKIEKIKSSLLSHRSDLDTCTTALTDLENKHDLAKTRDVIRSNLTDLNNELTGQYKQKDDLLKDINDSLFDPRFGYLAINLSSVVTNFKTKIDDFKFNKRLLEDSSKKHKETHARKLPIETPTSASIMNMLEDEMCWLCGRDATKDSKEYKYIGSHLKDWRELRETSNKNDLSIFFDSLFTSVGGQFSSAPPPILKRRIELQGRLDTIQDCITQLELQIKTKEAEYLNVNGSDDESLDLSIINKVKVFSKRQNDIEHSVKFNIRDLEEKTKHLASLNHAFSSLSSSGNQNSPILQAPEIFQEFRSKLIETADFFIQDIISNLESSVNENYQQLAKYETKDPESQVVFKFDAEILDGQLKRINIRRYDSVGIELPSPSTAYSMLTKLAIVMGIRDFKRIKNRKFNAPFIADAPTSNMQRSLTKGFFEHLPAVFSQSIIFTKDLFEEDNSVGEFGQSIIDTAKANGYSKVYRNSFDASNPTHSDTENEEI